MAGAAQCGGDILQNDVLLGVITAEMHRIADHTRGTHAVLLVERCAEPICEGRMNLHALAPAKFTPVAPALRIRRAAILNGETVRSLL
jgi:hypothetical protein